MPGSTSDNYDPEFGTGANFRDVADLARRTAKKLDCQLGYPKNIVAVAQGRSGTTRTRSFSEKEWRIIRFALKRLANE